MFKYHQIAFDVIFLLSYLKMSGAFGEQEISMEHREIMTANHANICARLNLEGTPELKIVKVFEQVVAGKFFWFHLVGAEGGNEFSVCIFQGLGAGSENLEISIAEPGHTEPRNPNS